VGNEVEIGEGGKLENWDFGKALICGGRKGIGKGKK